MYYDDQGRRFNLLSGLLFGTLLGAGIALLAVPEKRSEPARLISSLARGKGRRRNRVPAGIMDAIAASVADIRLRVPSRR